MGLEVFVHILLQWNLTQGAESFYRRFRFYSFLYILLAHKYHLLNMLKIKHDINQQALKIVNLKFH